MCGKGGNGTMGRGDEGVGVRLFHMLMRYSVASG